MKKYITAIGIASLTAGITSAHAQTSVKVYGVIDVGPSFVSNQAGSKTVLLQSGVSKQSRLGFEGVEDLGDGLEAVFRLESGFAVDDGSLGNGGALFNRESWVALRSKTAGSILAGNINTTTGETTGRYALATQQATSFLSNHPGDYDRTTVFSATNSVKYLTPELSGFTGQLQLIAGETPGGAGQNSGWNIGGNYENGPISVGASYLHQNGIDAPRNQGIKPNANPYGATGVGDQFNSLQFGTSYAVTSSATVSALVTQSTFLLPGKRARTYETGVKYWVNSVLNLSADYNYTRVANTAHLNVVSAGVGYLLSKQTDIYGVVGYEAVSGTNALGTDLVAQLGQEQPSSSNKQMTIHAGLRVRF